MGVARSLFWLPSGLEATRATSFSSSANLTSQTADDEFKGGPQVPCSSWINQTVAVPHSVGQWAFYKPRWQPMPYIDVQLS